jgi:hypothetical protein
MTTLRNRLSTTMNVTRAMSAISTAVTAPVAEATAIEAGRPATTRPAKKKYTRSPA